MPRLNVYDLIDPAGVTLLQSLPVPVPTTPAAVTTNGQHLLATDNRGRLLVFHRADEGSATAATILGANGVTWSDDQNGDGIIDAADLLP